MRTGTVLAAGLTVLVWPLWLSAQESLSLPQRQIDIIPPEINHLPNKKPVQTGSSADIYAEVTDDLSGVKEVILYFRRAGEEEFKKIAMQSMDGKTYIATIPAGLVQEPGIEYYIEAVDMESNKVLRGVKFSPLTLAVLPPVETPGQAAGKTSPGTGPEVAEGEEHFPSPEEEGKKNNWIWWAAGGVGASILLCYSSCDCAKTSGCNDKDTGTASVKVPSPTFD